MFTLTNQEQAQIKELIYKGEFQEAKKLIKNLSMYELENFLSYIAFEDDNFAIYGFIVSMLLDQETAEMHAIASVVMSLPLCHYEGAYSIGLFHARRAVELDDEDAGYKEFLLSFHDIPDHLILAAEAIRIAKQILATKPESDIAKRLIDYYKQLIES